MNRAYLSRNDIEQIAKRVSEQYKSVAVPQKHLSKKYSPNKFESFCRMADFLGVSRTTLSFRMEQLGLLERNLLCAR